ncbi:MAG: L,D-transpeptidase family protein [Fimbriimonadaceae bacterium]|nr:L,D-transpeptidase family protein [Fimbriimonadaceae bacterium]QYK59369.1 MAG: L,D-transpeptidase family protein [Fimbriimonadaceae bacterium]
MSLFALLVAGSAIVPMGQEPSIIDGVSFASKPGVLFTPLRETASWLGYPVEWDSKTRVVSVGGRTLKDTEIAKLFDGTKVVALRAFEELGSKVDFDPTTEWATVTRDDRQVTVRWPEQRVEVSLKQQTLRAWQGERLVMETPISSGRKGHRTPSGSFKAGPYKSRMHYSRLYNNSPMPWSVQINGHVFIHGYSSVPRYPASHGCIRMPLWGPNAARWFYNWVKVGTSVEVRQDFSDQDTIAGQSGSKS